jgi:tetratricopeptide (TPR) repeat protein
VLQDSPGLVRVIGRWSLTALMVNSIIGGSIFGLPNLLAAKVGALSPLFYLVTGVGILIIAGCIAKVSSRYDETGGLYLYARDAFGRFVGLLVAWLTWLTRITAPAAVANLFCIYLARFFPVVSSTVGRVLVLGALISQLALFNYIGVKSGKTVSNVSTVAKVSFLLLFVITGLLALALAGDSSRAQTLADDLEKRFPEDTCVRFSYLPTLRGLLALNRSEPAKAIDLLQTALPYDLGAPRSSFHGFFGALYPAYVRGQAYLAAHQGAEAAAEFQKILDHPGVVVSDPIGALARLQLGRAYVLSGDKTRAKSAYQDFITLWKDADPDIPILRQAKAEFARLQ